MNKSWVKYSPQDYGWFEDGVKMHHHYGSSRKQKWNGMATWPILALCPTPLPLFFFTWHLCTAALHEPQYSPPPQSFIFCVMGDPFLPQMWPQTPISSQWVDCTQGDMIGVRSMAEMGGNTHSPQPRLSRDQELWGSRSFSQDLRFSWVPILQSF